MAIQVISEVWEHSRASGTRLLVLLAMGDRARKEDAVCWPGRAAVAQMCRVGIRSVELHQAELCAMGELQLLRQGGGGPGDTSVYQITVGRYKGVTAFALRGDYRADPKGAKDFAHGPTGKGARDYTHKGEPATAPMDEMKGESKGESGGGRRAKAASLEPNAVDPLEPKEPGARVPHAHLEPSHEGELEVADGPHAGEPLTVAPSGRLQLARQAVGGTRR